MGANLSYRLLYNGKQIGEEVMADHSMPIEECLYFALPYIENVEDQVGLEKLYREGCEAVCYDDGIYFLDIDNIEFEYIR